MEIGVKSGKLRKKRFEIDRRNEKLLNDISKRFHISKDKIIERALMGKFLKLKENKETQKLKNHIDSHLSRMFTIESEWAALRYRAYTYMKDNKALAITLSGYLGENRSLANMMGKKFNHKEIEEIVNYYLWLQ